MPENIIVISIDEYRELLAKSERIAAVERLLANLEFVSVDEIKVVLDFYSRKTEVCDA